ncbi:hypothetical protein SAMN02927900_00133 [Rhizobium mongolense subsp. loessense]|uniref:Uncharacterized protein n=2 Tax=Rhizobium mongolense TaxID=57676 RepID=A0A1G4P8C0_9HYPH|nr:hypothetical protein SAMN02927900_00133 [Rhizobium mongolense subsp. loessense]
MMQLCFRPHGKCGSMLDTPFHPRDLPLFSEDLDVISGVLDVVCKARGLSRNTPEAEHLGALIIQLYRQGAKDSTKLAALAKAYF